jgi:hypothetical protein
MRLNPADNGQANQFWSSSRRRRAATLPCSRRNCDAKLRPAPSLLYKLNENQLALEAAILELSNWVEQRGSPEVGANVRCDLSAIDRNEELIKMSLAMMTPE